MNHVIFIKNLDTVHDVGEVHGIQRSIGDDKLGIHPSMKHVKRV
ncbi:unnamed protein product, partial [Rotaria magnacalcarata]